MTDEMIVEKFEFFKKRFASESDEIKNQVHYQSVINITSQLIKIVNKKETEPYKLASLGFFNNTEILDFPLGKSESLELYKNYVLYTGQYLIRKKDFRTSWDILKYIGIGILIDFIVYYLTKGIFDIYLPVFTLIFVALGLRNRRTKKIKMQYFGIGY